LDKSKENRNLSLGNKENTERGFGKEIKDFENKKYLSKNGNNEKLFNLLVKL